MKTLPWPLHVAPKIERAERYPMLAAQSGVYFHETIALHQHDYEGEVRIGDDTITLRRGDVTLTPPHAPSRYTLPAAGFHLCIHFQPVAAAAATARLPLHIPLSSEAAGVSQRFWWITDLHRRSARRGPAGILAGAAAAAGLQELLLWLALFSQRRRERSRTGKSDAALEQLSALLERRFHEPLTVPDLAREVGLSQNYLARHFRERYGMTIPRYLLVRRIELARHLLTATDEPVKAIAARTGLGDAHYFNKQFRRQTGLSPSEFRWSKAAGGGKVLGARG